MCFKLQTATSTKVKKTSKGTVEAPVLDGSGAMVSVMGFIKGLNMNGEGHGTRCGHSWTLHMNVNMSGLGSFSKTYNGGRSEGGRSVFTVPGT